MSYNNNSALSSNSQTNVLSSIAYLFVTAIFSNSFF